MTTERSNQTNQRRGFLNSLGAGATILGLSLFATRFNVKAEPQSALKPTSDADAWFNQIKGKHRMVFDATHPHEVFPFAWPRVFLSTNVSSGTPEKDCTAVVVLRHSAIAYAFENKVWEKYNFGELFKVEDQLTKAASKYNPFWQPPMGHYKLPGIGNVAIGINELQDSGVMFCVCDVALTVYSAAVAENMKTDAAEVKKDWLAGLLPKIQVVPSGVWGLNRAQEHGCSYCFTG